MKQDALLETYIFQEFDSCLEKHAKKVKNSLYSLVGYAYNEGYKEGLKEVESTEIEAEPDEWMEHHIRVEGYAKIYYQHTCVPQLVENPYRFCPFCGKKMKMKSQDMT